MNRSHYLQCVFDNFPKVIREAKKRLAGVEFDAVAFSGNSGAMVGPALAAGLKRKLILVRKRGADDHAQTRVEGWVGENDMASVAKGTYIIVDDFAVSGATVKRIVDTVAAERPGLKCIGVYFYNVEGCRDEILESGMVTSIPILWISPECHERVRDWKAITARRKAEEATEREAKALQARGRFGGILQRVNELQATALAGDLFSGSRGLGKGTVTMKGGVLCGVE